jgi:hypothetical protein
MLRNVVGDGLRQMLHICCQTLGSFLQPVNQRRNLRPARVWHQQPCDGKCGLLKFLELSPQLLAVFIELLQRFIAVDKVTVRGFLEIHVLDALIRQLLIFILKNLSGIFLSVDNVLQIGFRCFQLVYPSLEIYKSPEK